ncbi:MAG: GFA family protein [Rubrivivax sp.]|nr:MAG: GFA family protein [Rubrivivax sp.]
MKKLSGRCLCGAVRYEVNDNFKYSGFCHCSDCRRFSGSASSAMAGIPSDEFRFTSGLDAVKQYAKTAHTVLAFCSHCGSSLYAAKPQRGMVHLRLGTLDDAPSLRPQFHSYVASKAEWDTSLCDGLPQYPAGRS